jgi:hypothetical protein
MNTDGIGYEIIDGVVTLCYRGIPINIYDLQFNEEMTAAIKRDHDRILRNLKPNKVIRPCKKRKLSGKKVRQIIYDDMDSDK